MFKVIYKKYHGLPGKPIIINTKKEEYDSIPLIYCRNCMSIRIIAGDIDYCEECGSTTLGEVRPKDYEKLYYSTTNKYLGLCQTLEKKLKL